MLPIYKLLSRGVGFKIFKIIATWIVDGSSIMEVKRYLVTRFGCVHVANNNLSHVHCLTFFPVLVTL